MNIVTIAAIAAGLYFLASSKSSKPEVKQDSPAPGNGDKPSGGLLGGTGEIKAPKLPLVPKKVGGISILGCTTTQYEKDGKCVTFWDDNTEALVRQRILKKAQEWYNIAKDGPLHPENEPGTGYVTALCADENPKMGVYESNKNAIRIIQETIIELWPAVTNSVFPINEKSPNWLIEIWNRVVKIYYNEICGL